MLDEMGPNGMGRKTAIRPAINMVLNDVFNLGEIAVKFLTECCVKLTAAATGKYRFAKKVCQINRITRVIYHPA